MVGEHLPVHYRPAGADRGVTIADVCDTCSDFAAGLLVPVSFCLEAKVNTEVYYDYLRGGPCPDWLLSPDAARWVPDWR